MADLRRPSEFFFLTVDRDGANGFSEHILVVFCSARTVAPVRLAEALKHHFEWTVPADTVLLLAPAYAEASLRTAIEDADVLNRLPAPTRERSERPIRALTWGEYGTPLASVETEPYAAPEFLKKVRTQGLREIFDTRNGMLEAGEGFHFVKPSGAHARRFVRTSNVLVHSAEIDFVAFCLLPHFAAATGCRVLYTDTAGINSVCYSMVGIRQQFDRSYAAPAIDSFGSYQGLEDLKPYDAPRCFVVISSSTSGRLVRKIRDDLDLRSDRIVTLYYCGPSSADGNVLCDLTAAGSESGLRPIRSFQGRESCEHCRGGSTPVHIVGDQFLPTDAGTTAVRIRAKHAPGWIAQFSRDHVGAPVVFCEARPARPGGIQRSRELHLDPLPLLEAPAGHVSMLWRDVERQLRRLTPATLRWVVFLDDPGSKAMANMVKDVWRRAVGKDFDQDHCIASGELQEKTEQLGEGSVLVVAAAARSGRRLLEVSQLLRLAPSPQDRPIVYVIGLAQLENKGQLRTLESDLGYGSRPREFSVTVCRDIYLPADDALRPTPWALEGNLLDSILKEEAAKSDTALREQIEIRRTQLRRPGFRDSLFLPRVPELSFGAYDLAEACEPLRLTKGFALWPGHDYDPADVSQADVYLAMTGLLHHLRGLPAGEDSLRQLEHARAVIAPQNFLRFTDGVVQAALLRAARGGELDYRGDLASSRLMRDVLENIFLRATNRQGEAAPEFLLALALEQLRLDSPDEKHVLGVLEVDLGVPQLGLLGSLVRRLAARCGP